MSQSIASEGIATEPRVNASVGDNGDPMRLSKPEASSCPCYKNQPSQVDSKKKDPYSEAAEIVQKYSDEMIKQWEGEIDTLLVFAGLYSAILTAFNVQTYPYLQPSIPDPTVAILQQISLQLNSFTNSPPFINSTYLASTVTSDPTPPRADRWVVVLNVLWFSALVLSLSYASIGIMVKQWIREYQRGCSGISPEIARLRQYRLNRLVKWRVAEIVAILPILLHLSLFLFFSGLILLLWNFHSTVAIVVSTLVTIVVSITTGTTILSAVCNSCPYISPLTHVFLYFGQCIAVMIRVIYRSLIAIVAFICCLAGNMLLRAWLSYLKFKASKSGSQSLKIPILEVRVWDLRTLTYMIFSATRRHYAQASLFTTTRGQEITLIQESTTRLDVDMLVTDYAASMDPNVINVAMTLLMGHLPCDVRRYANEIRTIIYRHHTPWTVAICNLDIPDVLLKHCSGIRNNVRIRIPTYGKQLDQWIENLVDRFKMVDPREQEKVIFMLSVAVVPWARGSEVALKSLLGLFRNESGICQRIRWDVLKHVAALAIESTFSGFDNTVPKLSTRKAKSHIRDDSPNFSSVKNALDLFVSLLGSASLYTSESLSQIPQEVLSTKESVHRLADHIAQSMSTSAHYITFEDTATELLKVLAIILVFLSQWEVKQNFKSLKFGLLLEAVENNVQNLETALAERKAPTEEKKVEWKQQAMMDWLEKLKAIIRSCRETISELPEMKDEITTRPEQPGPSENAPLQYNAETGPSTQQRVEDGEGTIFKFADGVETRRIGNRYFLV